MTSNAPQVVQEYFREHGHYGLVREGEAAYRDSLPTLQDLGDLPEVDFHKLPESMGVSEWLIIENQLRVGSCRGHQTSSTAEVNVYRKTNGQIVQLNRMFSYITGQKIDGLRGDRGSSIQGGAKAAQQYGLPPESAWPYPGHYTSAVPEQCYELAKLCKLTTFVRIRNYNDAIKWAVHVGAMGIGIGWNGSCYPDDNVIRSYRSGGGGHALAAVDWYRKHSDTMGRPAIKVPNSHGTGYCDHGWVYVMPQAFDEMCRNETVIGFADMEGAALKPRKLDWRKAQVSG